MKEIMLRHNMHKRVTLFYIFVHLIKTCYLQQHMQRFVRHPEENWRLTEFILNVYEGHSKIVCCYRCMMDTNCATANHNSDTKRCILSYQTYIEVFLINSVEETGWIIYAKSSEYLVFRAVAGKGMTGETWLYGNPPSNNSFLCITPGNTDCSFYRNNIVDYWGSYPKTNMKIKFGLEKNGQEAAFIVFDGTESATLEDWFTAENIRKSSWPTLTPSTEFGKIGVHLPNNPRVLSWFIAVTSKGSCELDGGYTFTLVGNEGYCDYDTHAAYPQFFYSNKSTPTLFASSELALADAITISILV